MAWLNEVTFEYLELYKREEVLWDPKHPHHNNRSEVAQAWLRMKAGMSINCSISDLKKKKESLMSTFRLHLKRKKLNPAYRTCWFAYQQMESFLGGKYECDSTIQTDTVVKEDNELNFYSQNPEESIIRNTTQSDSTEKGNRSSTSTVEDDKNLDLVTELRCVKNQIVDALNIHNSRAAENKRDIDNSDECDLYGQLLTKKLKKMNERQRDMVMNEIDNVIFRAKMQSTVENNQYSQTTSPPPTAQPTPLNLPRRFLSPVSVYIATPQNIQQFDEEAANAYAENDTNIHTSP